MTGREEDWEKALALLGELLESRQVAPSHLVVCGGAALRAEAIVLRVTKDVDVLAMRGEIDGEISPAWPLPEALKEAVAEVAEELGLPENWLNASTSLLVGPLEQLPEQVWSDLRETSYGSRLRVSYVGRSGQIPLKLSAAIGRRASRDVDDLRALSPTVEELRRATAWLRKLGEMDSERQQRLSETLEALAYDHD